ncbi:ADP-ribosylglycohydrolase-domain-containing protein [Chlamydoabsidia padenii]|nr:ADP-ribosylglycohydrolase-domain-containing protein [Chlamydoabsidia padenii]
MRVPSGCSKIDKADILDKVKGLIFGAVIGDSLGIATEGMTKSQVSAIYGEGPIQFGIDDEGIPFLRDDYRSAFDDNDFGGDTEQQLLIIQSIIQTGTFNYKEYGKLLQKYSECGLQGLHKKPLGINKTSQDVVAHPEFATNPWKAAEDVWRSSNKRRGPSGALVRAALLGVPKFWDGTTVIENTTDCCRLTHPDPRCMMSCAIVSTLVARILRGQDLENDDTDDDINLMAPSLPPTPTSAHQTTTNGKVSLAPPPPQQQQQHYNMTPPPSSPPPAAATTTTTNSSCYHLETDLTLMKLVRNVIDTNKRILIAPNTDPLFRTPETDIELTRQYYATLVETCSYFEGGRIDFDFLKLDSWMTDNSNDDQQRQGSFECLTAGIYSFTRRLPVGQETEAFKHILMDLVIQGGEADTNATVAGALMGVKIGYSQLPSEWVVGLKRWEWLEDLVDEFCGLL